MAPKVTKETYLKWYELMLRIRRFEERAGMLYGQQKIRGFCHLYIGQEAVAAGTISALNPDDNIITAYRDHGLAIAKGMTCNAAMAELYGKSDGCSKGKGGSMHYFDKENRFFGGHGIVGAQIPLGAGIAFADKYNKTNRVTVCFFGDGAVWQGALHETFNLAALWKLPVIFVCENNGYAMGTSVKRSTKANNIFDLAKAYNMPGYAVDGMQPEKVYEKMHEVAEYARNGEGPVFLEIRTYRYKGHSMSDPQKYRTKEEVDSYKKLDPLETVRELIIQKGFATEQILQETEKNIDQEIDACVEFAENSPWPEDSEVYNDIYTQTDYPFLVD